MATRNPDGSVVLRTKGSLAYTPSVAGTTALSRPNTAKRLGGGGFESSGRLKSNLTTVPKSARV
jgi:hypothetical protein